MTMMTTQLIVAWRRLVAWLHTTDYRLALAKQHMEEEGRVRSQWVRLRWHLCRLSLPRDGDAW